MAKVGNGMVKIYDGITEGFSKMMVNAPTYAKLPLYTAGAITAGPLLVASTEYLAARAIVFPERAFATIGYLESRYLGGMSPGGGMAQLGGTAESFINNGGAP